MRGGVPIAIGMRGLRVLKKRIDFTAAFAVAAVRVQRFFIV